MKMLSWHYIWSLMCVKTSVCPRECSTKRYEFFKFGEWCPHVEKHPRLIGSHSKLVCFVKWPWLHGWDIYTTFVQQNQCYGLNVGLDPCWWLVVESSLRLWGRRTAVRILGQAWWCNVVEQIGEDFACCKIRVRKRRSCRSGLDEKILLCMDELST